MQSAITGNDIGRLVQEAQALGARYGPVPDGMAQPYEIGAMNGQRYVFLDGTLQADRYYQALSDALAELKGSNVVVLRAADRHQSRRTS